jgi:two-component system sensor histidine kinase/response regulator
MSQSVLIVEDDEDLRGSIQDVLADRGYVVYAASDGQAALELLESQALKPDVIVSDIGMPRMDGYEFFYAIHQSPNWRAIPFIFLTARGTKQDLHYGRKIGVDDYLVKPFEPDEFVVAVENKMRRAGELRQQAASELDDARRTMIQLLSHELRTPLTYVTGGYSLLADELGQTQLPPYAESSLSLIQSGANRLTRLTEQMILYAELAAGHVHLQIQTAATAVHLQQAIDTSVAQLRDLAVEQNAQVTTENRAGRAVYSFGLPDMLTHAVGEVMRNAIMYTTTGKGRVHVTLDQQDSIALITIADNGCGILPNDIDSVWKVLIQSDRKRREQQGAGMGLPIARMVVEAHGGHIELKSVVNQGTEVTFRLPAY